MVPQKKGRRKSGRVAVTTIMVALGALVCWRLWIYYMEDPWTRDGRVRADVVAVAPDVSGLVSEVLAQCASACKTYPLMFSSRRVAPRQASGNLTRLSSGMVFATVARIFGPVVAWMRARSEGAHPRRGVLT